MVSAGVFAFFFLDVANNNNVVYEEIEDINNLIDNNNLNVRSLLSRVVKDCATDNKECITVKTFKYLKSNIIVGESVKSGYSAYGALSEKEGDAIDISLLLASMLANAEIKSMVYFDDGKPYVYVSGLDTTNLYNAIIEDMRASPLATRELKLKKDQIWAVNLSDGTNKPLPIEIEADGTKTFDMMLFSDMEEVNRYFTGSNGVALNTCNLANTNKVEQSCMVPADSVLVFISHGNDNLFDINIFKSGFIPSDISEKNVEGKQYIPIDVTLSSEYLYPGVIN